MSIQSIFTERLTRGCRNPKCFHLILILTSFRTSRQIDLLLRPLTYMAVLTSPRILFTDMYDVVFSLYVLSHKASSEYWLCHVCPCVRPSVHIEQLDIHQTAFRENFIPGGVY